MTRTLTAEHKAKLKATRAERREKRATAFYSSGPYDLRFLDADNVVVETAGGDPLYYPATVDGLIAGLSWITAQRLSTYPERAKSVLRGLEEILAELRRIAEALAKEAGR